MLIVNDEQRLRAGIASLSKRCSYCTKALAAYPLIVSDDARLQVYHAACAAALATEILVDLYTFLSPPAPYQQLFVLTTSSAAPPQQICVQREEPVRDAPQRASKGVTDAIDEYPRLSRRRYGIGPSSAVRKSVAPWGQWSRSAGGRDNCG